MKRRRDVDVCRIENSNTFVRQVHCVLSLSELALARSHTMPPMSESHHARAPHHQASRHCRPQTREPQPAVRVTSDLVSRSRCSEYCAPPIPPKVARHRATTCAEHSRTPSLAAPRYTRMAAASSPRGGRHGHALSTCSDRRGPLVLTVAPLLSSPTHTHTHTHTHTGGLQRARMCTRCPPVRSSMPTPPV